MIRKSLIAVALSMLALAMLGTWQSVHAANDGKTITLAAGHSTVYALVEPVKRVAIGDPAVAELRVIDNSALYVLGRKIGTTNLMIWPRSGATPYSVDLRVTRDVSALQADLTRLFPQETQLRVAANGESLVLGGRITDATNAAAIIDLAKQFAGADKVSNLMTGASVPQVLLEVKVAEVSKTLIDRLGAKLNLTSGTSRTITLLGNFLSGSAASLTGVDGTDSVTLDAETRNGLIKILAEPTILALSGEQGEFLAGGKIFIPVAQGSTGGVNGGAITLEELTIVNHGAMLHESLAAATELAEDGFELEIVDLRSVKPLDTDTILASVARTGRLLCVSAEWPWGGVTAEVIARVSAEGFGLLDVAPMRVNAKDTPVPYHPDLWSVHRPTASTIAAAARRLLHS